MNINMTTKKTSLAILVVGFLFIVSTNAWAHCDSLDGPVIADAKTALESGKVTPVLKWVKAEHEAEIRDVFSKTLVVRKAGATARGLADQFFFETLVRIHRAGEGAPYTGLKPAGKIDRAVVLADQALESGSPDKMIKVLKAAVEKGIRSRHATAVKRKKRATNSTKAGREFVEAYVEYVHFVEGLHNQIKRSGHLHGSATTQSEHKGH